MSPILGGLQGPVCPAQCLLVGLKENSLPWPCSRGQDAKMQSTLLEIPAPHNAAPGPHFPRIVHARIGTVSVVLQQPWEITRLRLFASQRKRQKLRGPVNYPGSHSVLVRLKEQKPDLSSREGGRAQWLENRLWCHPTMQHCTIY